MKKFDNLIIVSDMDGTFFGEKATVLNNNIEAIRFFQKNGGIFTLATGRDYKILEQKYSDLREYLSCPAILCNGSYLYDFKKKEKIYEIELNKEEALNIVSLVKNEIPESSFRVSFDKGFLCDNKNKIPFSPELAQELSPIIIFDDPLKYKDVPWHKLVFSSNGEKGASADGLSSTENNWIPKAEKIISQIELKTLFFTTSSGTLLELLPKEASKGKALINLRKLFPNKKIICVGDYLNDMDMLQSADIPACPANALDQVKNICKVHLCDHREGCIADLIYKLDSIV